MHSAMAAKRVHELAEGTPYILAGDFNIKPKEGPYTLLTTGEMPEDRYFQTSSPCCYIVVCTVLDKLQGAC